MKKNKRNTQEKSMNDTVLSVKGLKTYFYTKSGIVKAVNELEYDVKRGECVAIVGESGCGKSVSSMSILRIIGCPPGLIVGGEILFNGEDLLKASEARMREIRGNQISMIFQDATTSLNPVLKVGKQLSEMLILHRRLTKKQAREESLKLLKMVGIPDAEKRINEFPHQFSGGMQQRIMIAMALACNPKLIIADEPTTALDVTVQAQVLELLDHLRKEYGTAVILITHNLGIVARYVDRVNVMYAGRIIENGYTDEIYKSPKHPYTKGLLNSVPRLDRPKSDDLKTIGGAPPNLTDLKPGCSFAPRCAYANDRCRQESPKLYNLGNQHGCACFLMEKEGEEADE